MSGLITTHGLTKAFTDRPLFSGLSLTIESGERIGLIGPNGAGKTTLLKILSSQMEPDAGEIISQKGLRVGFLQQSPRFDNQASILSTLLSGSDPSQNTDSHGLAHEFISRLGLNEFGADALVENLSGGWKKRVALARELIKKPDLLFLDEPTNHLDIASIVWLESFLAQAPFAVLTITHDRLFLQRVANRIIELNPRHPGGMLSVRGDYSQYLEVRQQNFLAQENQEASLKNTLRRETQWLRQGAKARTTKQQARIHRAGELQQEVEELGLRNQTRFTAIDFKSGKRSPKKLLEAKHLGKSFGNKVIFSDFNLVLTPGSRMGLLGANGAGKSTLIRTLIGAIEPTSGKVLHSDQLKISYFDQTREELNLQATLIDTLCPAGDHVVFQGKSIHIASYLNRFLFSKAQMRLKVGRLSGGEQSRLLLARLMLTPASLLVLDEPTNDLDIATLDVLQQCLREFDGAIILVTHDRYFLDQVCNQLFAFPSRESQQSHLLAFADFNQWETWNLENETKSKPLLMPQKPAQVSITSKPLKKKKLSFKDQYELEGMETAIQKAEQALEDLTNEMALPVNLSNATLLTDLSQKMATIQSEIDRLYERWHVLENK